jgi:hypothetical protein
MGVRIPCAQDVVSNSETLFSMRIHMNFGYRFFDIDWEI